VRYRLAEPMVWVLRYEKSGVENMLSGRTGHRQLLTTPTTPAGVTNRSCEADLRNLLTLIV